jgi:D-alanine-D-alanine ligase
MSDALRKKIPGRRVVVLYTEANEGLDDELRATIDLSTTARAVAEILGSSGHEVKTLPFGHDTIEVAGRLRALRPDIVFNLAECPLECNAKEPHGAALLELLRLPYTGCGPLALALCKDKAVAKQILAAHRLPTSQFEVFLGDAQRSSRLSFPLIVKPLTEDGSLGIAEESIVANRKELRARVAFLREEHGQDAIAEEFLGGREFIVTVVGNGTADAPHRVLPPGEYVYHSDCWRVCTFKAKWDEAHPSYAAVEACYPATLSVALRRQLERLALACARIFAIRGYARIDFRLDRSGRPHVLEVNPNPDLSPGAGISRTAESAGFTYADFLQEILRLGAAEGVR